MSATPNPLSTSKPRRSRYAPGESHCKPTRSSRDAPPNPGLPEFGNIIAPRLHQPTGMRGPEIHISDGGYGFRARSFHSRQNDRSRVLHQPDQLLISADQVLSLSL